MRPRIVGAALLVAATALASAAVLPQQPFDPQGRPNRRQPGPWDNDVIVYRAAIGGAPGNLLSAFPRAGVPTVTRLADGRLIAAHQHFPADNDADFDKVAVHFSSDEGRSWTPPVVIRVDGLPAGARFPFDPTLVALPDGRVRLYFTLMIGRIDRTPQVIGSAISSDGIAFIVEPGVRFAVEGRPVIDCAVVLHKGVFHVFAPDNGPAGSGLNGPPPDGVGYHAVSRDGLTFARAADVRVAGGRRWLGNVQSDGDVMRFFGTGGPGVWTATSVDGEIWSLDAAGVAVPGADPGAVKLRDGSWLIVATGPPRR